MRAELAHIATRVREAAIWRPANARLLLWHLGRRNGNPREPPSDRDHLVAAAAWLERAQDVTGDGGICGRYHLRRGWSSSYPETTGYIIPTFLSLAAELHDERFRDRAAWAVDFLLSVQLKDGAFPGGEIANNPNKPAAFNSAQIIHGLVRWYAQSGDERSLNAAVRAGEWLVRVQDSDGAWRRNFYVSPSCYSAHAACWLAELGQYLGEDRFLQAASRNIDWIVSRFIPHTGWFNECGFTQAEHAARVAVTHTIAYTLWGVLMTCEILSREDGLVAVARAGSAVARVLAEHRTIPGMLDHQWRPRSRYTCPTGTVQLALVWLRLYELHRDPVFLEAALRAIEIVKAVQLMDDTLPAMRGGISGSDPIWGEYLTMAFPNWAAKFFIDALLAKQRIISQAPPDGSRT